jgi:hypothetical protein
MYNNWCLILQSSGSILSSEPAIKQEKKREIKQYVVLIISFEKKDAGEH